MNKKTNNGTGRQGDVYLKRISKLPKNAVAQQNSGDRIILAFGEVTGHHHSIAATPKITKYVDPETQATYLEVAEALALLEHQEHDTVPLTTGTYEVIKQNEYTPEAIRPVAD